MNIENISAVGFDARALAESLPSEVIGGWSRDAVIEEAAICWLNGIRLRNNNRWEPIFPEADTLGARDIVTLAGIVSKIGVERFGKALKDELDVNRLTDAVKRGRFNLDQFIISFDAGICDSRYFGQALQVAPKAIYRDQSGFTRRDKLEMSAAYALDRERSDWDGVAITDEDMLLAREEQALWPAAEKLEEDGIDIVALERARSLIGTQAFARLYAAGFNLFTLGLRVRNGLNALQLVSAFNAGIVTPKVFNKRSFPVGAFGRNPFTDESNQFSASPNFDQSLTAPSSTRVQ